MWPGLSPRFNAFLTPQVLPLTRQDRVSMHLGRGQTSYHAMNDILFLGFTVTAFIVSAVCVRF